MFAIGVIFVAALIPLALDDIFAVNTSAWDTGAAALWAVVGLAIVASVVLYFVPSRSE